jgi:hypothetical protein
MKKANLITEKITNKVKKAFMNIMAYPLIDNISPGTEKINFRITRIQKYHLVSTHLR